MTPAKYNFKPHRRGDTFNGVVMTIKLDGALVDFTGAVAKLQVKRNPDDTAIIEWLSSDGGITFGAGVVNINSKTGAQMNLDPGVYIYDLQVLLGNGVTNTYTEGQFIIINDITR